MQSYPLHTHNVVLFLVSRWKQMFGVRRVVLVADMTWENIDLTFSSLWVRHSILITSTFGNCYDDSLHLGIITHPADPIAECLDADAHPKPRQQQQQQSTATTPCRQPDPFLKVSLQKKTLPWWYVFVTVGHVFCHACTSMTILW